ncbi:uncharacterized protein LOC133779282 [Humulus lupulus]|uniref:uncharacterized protein LOC133779282 n=1 Tax=Humulus lupulus TaxID=3486 RepID=UPI002B400EA3|nr:uncharacterized protein LOC133779282 [Humulus lupulus]
MFRKNKVGIGGLMETKLQGRKIDEFMEHRFPNWDYFSSPNTEVDTRRSLWRDLSRISLSVNAWMVIGDFNAPFSAGDISSGCPIASSELGDSIGWKSIAKVEAIKSMGSYFTWTNNQDGLARIYSKIDHAINEDWLDVFPQSLAVFQWEVVSDHCSCIVSNIALKSMGTKLFKYYNFWSSHPDFNQLVLKSWNAPVQASGLKAIFARLVRLKHQLKKLNRDWFGDVGLGYQVAMEALQTAQFQAQARPLDFQLQEAVREKASEFHYHEQIYHSFLVQRSKINWIRNGDVNSSFFHAFLKKRKAVNSIGSFINENGEIKAALFSIPNTKSPGPDGYGSGFFKSMWKDIGQDICSAITHSFAMGHFPKELYETTLSFIPKVANPARASDYRPIAYDVILFCKGSVEAVTVLKDSLMKFNDASGLAINSKKSQVYFGGVIAEDRIEIQQVLQLPAGSFPLHYLGVPSRPTKWKHMDCEIIIQKMRVKLFSWSSKHLSYAGRLLLIQTVLAGLRNFWMSVFNLPQSIIKEVEKLCRQFLWGASGTRSKFHLASWYQVFLPKAYGGLGLRDGSSWNRALLARNRFCEREILAAGLSGIFKPSKLYNSSLNQQVVAYKNGIWCRTILLKHRFLLWMAVNSFLLTRDNLAKCTIDSLLCPVCEDQWESHSHLFFDCCLSKKVLK